MADLSQLQSALGYSFKNPALLRLALTHPSIAYEVGPEVETNQRLEFLGDSVLGLILSGELYEKFRHCSEGPLTKARAQMVNRKTLANQAKCLNLGDYLILSRGEQANLGPGRNSALSDAFESVIGAIFLDGGYEAAREFVLRNFHDAFGELKVLPNLENPKGELQELLQARSPDAPEYATLTASGPEHDRDFVCVVRHGGVELGEGKGKSKKLAESAAASSALDKLTGKFPEKKLESCGKATN
ncbi:MAG: ribonuclease III [Verrucomicrobiota bacterium]